MNVSLMLKSYLYRFLQPNTMILLLTLLNVFKMLWWNRTVKHWNNPDILEYVKCYTTSIYNGLLYNEIMIMHIWSKLFRLYVTILFDQT